jgi:LmbE family N-acetylglucosaminyl deacetylase/glycosyltransferase involved in cell wall biosynthesis
MTALLTDGLVARGHDVTLFATGTSVTNARLHATFPRGYGDDESLWPWELCELFNVAAAVERAGSFDVIHCQAEYYPVSLAFSRVCRTPLVHTLHHAPSLPETALWSRYAEASFVAVSEHQRLLLAGLNVVGRIHHAVDTGAFAFRSDPEDYLVFLGRFTEGKGVVQAIDIARRAGMRLLLAAAENEYYRDHVRPLVDGNDVVYVGELDRAGAARLLGGARALVYPVQAAEPFGLVLAEAASCGTPIAALDRGAVREIVDEGVTGGVFDSVDALVAGLPRVLSLDRRTVRARAVERFGIDRMVDAYVAVYRRLVAELGSDPRLTPMPPPFAGRSLLAVFAHPDDESIACGATLAWCADQGARVTVVCATAGELGQGMSDLPRDTRIRELQAAARVLGVGEVVTLDYPDGQLPWVDAAKLEADIGELIRRVRPDVVITFDEDGLYWHPDHIAIHERTTAAVATFGEGAPALYYVSMAPGRMRMILDAVGARGTAGRVARRILGIDDVDAFGAMAPAPTLVIEAEAFGTRKLAAIKCHRTQLVDDALGMLSDDEATRLLATECFRRAPVGSPGGAFIEHLVS